MLIVIPTTILLTLFASWLMGYTINRVSLFALIFSIGILVDDAIVVVENIARHWAMRDGRSLAEAAVDAVSEVGNPTIVATLTIIAALLPMMFVSGMMGPYMSPIPANASIAMLFSFFVAVTVTPWLLLRFARRRFDAKEAQPGGHHDVGAMGRFYARVARPLLKGRIRSKAFLIAVGLATLAACSLFVTKDVRVKLLPFDNKSEIQVVLDLPHGASLEQTDRALMAAADRLKDLPELVSIQAYAGTAAPFNFNGLVRHYYLRADPQPGRPFDQSRPLKTSAGARATRSRSTSAVGSPISRCPPAPRSRWSRFRRDRRCWRRSRLKSMDRTRQAAARSPGKCARRSNRWISSSTSTTVSACRPTACASRSTRRRSNSTASRSRRSTTRSAPSSAG